MEYWNIDYGHLINDEYFSNMESIRNIVISSAQLHKTFFASSSGHCV